ncbi:CCA tRNA nucleotidyltransferase [Bartonella sp. HY329]|uniref:CCA tRNA nucleotidyltransferase n=1 Tax=unclassified Bartonella TaxID=2645622 RepID=UPI0021C890EA|nr:MULTISPECIES: CCA tRNA nucleotidyltransferase [unclassified Bartonella]UXM94227.1 CCA tRNA nucleotidyltransferase [Bartonella sp. HY329]UXN08550.1 CCA tRNA nucleotidyltransferase [Bartonella sp. HY328]
MKLTKDKANWLFDERLQKLLKVLGSQNGEARIVGGAVRNALMGKPINDIDIATTHLPDATTRLAQQAGFHAVPTGEGFGTITVVVDHHPFEVTTLRQDVTSDGRHPSVVFGKDWQIDAQRRDFTINALYCDHEGVIYDDVGGLADIETSTLRFIGNAEDRIKEDYLRILRFFRFFAFYGKGRPDAEGLKASARLKNGLNKLSAERIWAELKKLLSAKDPSRALLWMRQAGILTAILPESEKWGIDFIHGLIASEQHFGWDVDPFLRLEAIIPPDAERVSTLGNRLKLANIEKKRLSKWALLPAPKFSDADMLIKKLVYQNGAQAVLDHLRLMQAKARSRGIDEAHNPKGEAALIEAANYGRMINLVENWPVPEMPISGEDLIALGIEPGVKIGQLLKGMEQNWIDSGFLAKRDVLLKDLDIK